MSRDSLLGVEPGQVIAERYRVEALIGRGAMGAVWHATHLRLASPLAIKFLAPSIAGDPEMLERFMREARSAALVRSTHVVQIFDHGVERGIPYIAMERLVGETLESRLSEQGPLSNAELDKIFGEVARAVGVAHDAGVIHRDLKPANVFLAREGAHEITKVLDFGIAKLLDQKLSAPADAGTQTGIMLGTPHYMSPEQARGNRGLDHRTDLWSLAVLCFECVTGRLPFEGQALGDLMVNICTRPALVPSAVAEVPRGFDEWFAKGVMKEPAERFQSAVEMAESLHALLVAAPDEVTERPVVAATSVAGVVRPASLTTHGASTKEARITAGARFRSSSWALAAILAAGASIWFFTARPQAPRESAATLEARPLSAAAAAPADRAEAAAAALEPAPPPPGAAPTVDPVAVVPEPIVVSEVSAEPEQPPQQQAPQRAKPAPSARRGAPERKPALPAPSAPPSPPAIEKAPAAAPAADAPTPKRAAPIDSDPFAERL